MLDEEDVATDDVVATLLELLDDDEGAMLLELMDEDDGATLLDDELPAPAMVNFIQFRLIA